MQPTNTSLTVFKNQHFQPYITILKNSFHIRKPLEHLKEHLAIQRKLLQNHLAQKLNYHLQLNQTRL